MLILVMLIALVMPFWILIPSIAQAHPGGTAGDGCHYCRTNCDSWGETWNARHCHGGGGGYTAPRQPSCPYNSYRSGDSCSCNYGYAPSLSRNSCVKIPSNAHEGNRITDVWECDFGYIESGNRCIKKVKVPDPIEREEPEVENDVSEVVLQKMEKIMGEMQDETSSASKDNDGTSSFLWGAGTMAGGYWLYKKMKN